MANMYGSPNGMPIMEPPKASQACMSCRKQKRKCTKALPACALCERMNRHCDYTDATPPPSSEDFNALRMRLMELEAKFNGGNGELGPTPTFATPSSSALSGPEGLGHPPPAYNHPQEYVYQGVQNRFPAIAFLDSDCFRSGGYVRKERSYRSTNNVLASLYPNHLSIFQL